MSNLKKTKIYRISLNNKFEKNDGTNYKDWFYNDFLKISKILNLKKENTVNLVKKNNLDLCDDILFMCMIDNSYETIDSDNPVFKIRINKKYKIALFVSNNSTLYYIYDINNIKNWNIK